MKKSRTKREFDSFFYLPTGKTIEFADALCPDNLDLKSEYNRNYLYCPECREAQLTFTKKETLGTSYLSTHRSSQSRIIEHNTSCSHKYKKATKPQLTEYYKTLTPTQIKSKLTSAIDLYLRQTEDENVQLPANENHPTIITVSENGNQVHKRLPKRSLYSIYSKIDENLNIPILLYGKVKFKVIKKSPQNDDSNYNYFLNMHSIKDESLLRYFYRANNFDNIDTNKIYYVALIAVFKRKNGTLYSDLYNQDSILYQPI